MAYIRAGTVASVADALGAPPLAPATAAALAPHADVRLREVVQDALKVARACKRAHLTASDVDAALAARGEPPLLGWAAARDGARFARAAGHGDLYYVEDPELSFEELIETPLPRPPVEVSVLPHWLAINGVQPATPENARLPIARTRRGRAAPCADDGALAGDDDAVAGGAGPGGEGEGDLEGVLPPPLVKADAAATVAAAGGDDDATRDGALLRAPVRHALSEELAAYLERAAGALLPASSTPPPAVAAAADAAGIGAPPPPARGPPPPAALRAAVLDSLATDPGLGPLAPYLVKLVADGVRAHLRDGDALTALMRAARAVASNPRVALGPYLHTLLPALVTVCVARRLGAPGSDAHWGARDAAADAAGVVCGRYGRDASGVPARFARTMLKALGDPSLPLPSHYGAVRGLAALGPRAVRALLLPALGAYAATLDAAEEKSGDKNGGTHSGDVARVHAAALEAAGRALYGGAGGPRTAAWVGDGPPPPHGVRVAAAAAGGDAASPSPPPPTRKRGRGDAEADARPATRTSKSARSSPAVSRGGRGRRGRGETPTEDGGSEREPPSPSPALPDPRAAARAALHTAWREGAVPGDVAAALHELFGEAGGVWAAQAVGGVVGL